MDSTRLTQDTPQYLGPLYRALDADEEGPWPPDGLAPLLDGARRALRPLARAPGSDRAALALRRLARLARSRRDAAGALARRLYDGESVLAEDALLARALDADAALALELVEMRQALASMHVPDSLAELAMDVASSREQASYALVWSQPHRLEDVRATFERCRRDYFAVYRKAHAAHAKAVSRLAAALEVARPRTRALARLNTLGPLGGALGRDALARISRLRGFAACPHREPVIGAKQACECGFALGERAPVEEIDAAIRSVDAALNQQMARLAGEAVRRVLARATWGVASERIDRFLEVVRASDVAGLVSVLDDELVEFLRDLLASPVERVPAFLVRETPPAKSVLDGISRAFPVVAAAQVDAAVDEFRRLLLEALEAARRAAPESDPEVRLAPDPLPRQGV